LGNGITHGVVKFRFREGIELRLYNTPTVLTIEFLRGGGDIDYVRKRIDDPLIYRIPNILYNLCSY
jgi:hypothetical protein